MKIIKKSAEPPVFKKYRTQHPTRIWEKVPSKRQQACRQQCMTDQGNICCYCECNLNHPRISNFCRVEHFHQKSDTTPTGKNWHLDWQNMLAACNGQTEIQDRKLLPHPMNLSCDAHKNYLIQKGKLLVQCEGLLVNPLQLPPFPNLFRVSPSTGELLPDQANCLQVTIPDNQCSTTEELIQNTITILNLNCDRLCQQRKSLLQFIDRKIAQGRQEGKSPEEVFSALLNFFFRTKWPAYFTTIRCRLGKYAEDYLHSISFQG